MVLFYFTMHTLASQISLSLPNTVHEVCKDLWLLTHMDRMTPPIGGDGVGFAFFVNSEMESPHPEHWASGEAVSSPSYSATNLWLRNWYKRSGEIFYPVQSWSLQESSIWGPVMSVPYKHEHKKHTCCTNASVWVNSSSITLQFYSALTELVATWWLPSPSLNLCNTYNRYKHFHILVTRKTCTTNLQRK